MSKENKYRWFWRTLFILFVMYVALFISVQNGYYERENYRNAYLTEEKIQEFESDVKNNKEVDIKDYLEDNTKDYSSPLSNLAIKMSNSLQKVMTKVSKKTNKLIKKYFT